MKKFIPLTAVLFLWTASVIGSDRPPFSETRVSHPFYISETTDQPERFIEIFPNPVTEGRLTIKTTENFRSVQLLNITGEIVFTQEYPYGTVSEVIELDKLEKGIYLVRILFAGKVTHTEKIMIK